MFTPQLKPILYPAFLTHYANTLSKCQQIPGIHFTGNATDIPVQILLTTLSWEDKRYNQSMTTVNKRDILRLLYVWSILLCLNYSIICHLHAGYMVILKTANKRNSGEKYLGHRLIDD